MRGGQCKGHALGAGVGGGEQVCVCVCVCVCVKKWPDYILRMLGQGEEAARAGVGASLTCQV